MERSIRALNLRAHKEGAVLLVCFASLLIACIHFQMFERLVVFVVRHEVWNLDEFLTAMLLLPPGLLIFSHRRLMDAKAELMKRFAAEKEVARLTLFDPLTGLPSRRAAEPAIQEALANAQAAPFALLMIDVKRFKTFNHLHGHGGGDAVLVCAAERLSSLAQEGDLVVRLGGGAFLMLLRDGAPGEALVGRVHAISNSFNAPLKPASLAEPVALSLSIGVTAITEADISADAALGQAAVAMRRAKDEPGNSLCFFEPGMDSAARRRAQLEIDLRHAIAAGDIVPAFQPVVEQKTGRILGYEALARWQSHDGTVHSPEDFVAVAEETGQIDELYYLVLERAARMAAGWPAHLYVAVNISPRQLSNPWLVENTLRILAKAGLPAGRLEVEITETAFAADLERASALMAEFKRQRIRIALDDFGTGYSSFRLLRELRFDKLKIDRSFVSGLDVNPTAREIVHAIASMAHLLQMDVTVEGVEVAEIGVLTQRLGCEYGQGFFYGAPQADPLAGDRVEIATAPRQGPASPLPLARAG